MSTSILVVFFLPNLSASSGAPIVEGRSVQNTTSNLLGFDPSSCRGVYGPNPWALSLASSTVNSQSDSITSNSSSQTSPSGQEDDSSTILQLNPLVSTNDTALLGFGSQCETIAVLDFITRPQDGGVIRTPALTLTPFTERSYWLSTGLNVGPPQVTYWRRNRGALAWTKVTLRVQSHSTVKLDFDVAGEIAFDYSLMPSTQPTAGTIAVFRIRTG